MGIIQELSTYMRWDDELKGNETPEQAQRRQRMAQMRQAFQVLAGLRSARSYDFFKSFTQHLVNVLKAYDTQKVWEAESWDEYQRIRGEREAVLSILTTIHDSEHNAEDIYRELEREET